MRELGKSPRAAACIADGMICRIGADRAAQLERLVAENPNRRARRELKNVSAEMARSCQI